MLRKMDLYLDGQMNELCKMFRISYQCFILNAVLLVIIKIKHRNPGKLNHCAKKPAFGAKADMGCHPNCQITNFSEPGLFETKLGK